MVAKAPLMRSTREHVKLTRLTAWDRYPVTAISGNVLNRASILLSDRIESFLPHVSILTRGICIGILLCLSVWPSLCPWRSGIRWTRLNISSIYIAHRRKRASTHEHVKLTRLTAWDRYPVTAISGNVLNLYVYWSIHWCEFMRPGPWEITISISRKKPTLSRRLF